MNRWFAFWLVMMACLLLLAPRCPAPLIYTPGEGWRYEKPGDEGGWQRTKPKEQLEVAEAALANGKHSVALKAARRVVSNWRFSDYAPRAQYIVGRCYEAKQQDERAFKSYQKLLEQYPKIDNYNEVVKRQFEIANRYLAGQWYKVFNTVPLYRSMDKTIKLYEQVIKNGPYGEFAPISQINIAKANENRRTIFLATPDYAQAAKAYEKAADRYSDQKIGVDALYQVGVTYTKQAKKAEFDQSVAGQAILTFTDFTALHPDDSRVTEAQKMIASMKTEQARGNYDIARYYERQGRWKAARIYYSYALHTDPASSYADQARKRLFSISKAHPESALE